MTNAFGRHWMRSPVRDQPPASTQKPRKPITLSGNSESCLESICDRLRSEYYCAINVSPVKAVFLETIREQTEAEGKYIRQTGGSGNYGHCKLRIEPNEPGKGYEFVNDIMGEVVPKEYIKPIEKGIQGAMEAGILSGFRVVDVKVTLLDGSYHESDSNESAFESAAAMAFKEAVRKACPIVMDPVMAVEIQVPEGLEARIRSEVWNTVDASSFNES
jgi:elongation factor G